eukprot:gene1185-1498_t
MQYVNGHDISSQSINDVLGLSLSPKIPWTVLENESNEYSTIFGYSSRDKGIYLNKGVSEFPISPENMYELLYNISQRTKWDIHCTEAQIIEEYDHLNHIVHLEITHPLGQIKMNLYRSCKYDPHSRLYVIAMRSVELEDSETDIFECLPNGWVIQAVDGFQDRCRLTFVQQCHIRDIELQKIPGYKSFSSKETMSDFHYLTIFPASVSGRLGKIFQCITDYITKNEVEIKNKDTRLSIIEQAERELNEMFGTTTTEYGWEYYLKKYDMELLTRKSGDSYFMIGKGSFSSVYTPAQIADLLYCDQPFIWDTFYDKGIVVENVNETNREVELFYRMWHESFSMRVLQSIKKGPGNCSACHWRGVSQHHSNHNDMDVSYLPSGIFNYGLGEGSFTTFLVAVEVKGAKSAQEEDLVTKFFAARIISTQNHIINVMNKMNKRDMEGSSLPVIPTIMRHCETIGVDDSGFVGGAPTEFQNMVETFANLFLSENSNNANTNSKQQKEVPKNKRKRGTPDEPEPTPEPRQPQGPSRPTIRITTNIISNKMSCNDGMLPKIWNESKKQPFLFLVSESSDKSTRKLQRKDMSISNSCFDFLPEEIIQLIFSFLSASEILTISMVCKRFKIATDSSNLWKQLYIMNPLFHKSVPRRSKSKPKPLMMAASSTTQDGASVVPSSADTNPMAGLVNLLSSVENPMALITQISNMAAAASNGGGAIPGMEDIAGLLNGANLSNLTALLQDPSSLAQLIPAQLMTEKAQELEVFVKMVAGLMAGNSMGGGPGGMDSDGHRPKDKNCGCAKGCLCDCRDGCNCSCMDESMIGVTNWRYQYMEKVKLIERWNQAKPKKKIELKGHAKTIRSLKGEGSTAVSVSNDKKVRFWNLNSGQCIGIYEEPSSAVLSMDYDRSYKSSVIWPLSDYTKIHMGHKNGFVTLVDFLDQPHRVISSERTILLADGYDFSCPGKFIIWEEQRLVCWDEEKKALHWEVPTAHAKKINQAKVIPRSTVATHEGIVCTTSSDKTVKIWNLENGSPIASLGGYSGVVNCVEPIGDCVIATGSSDKLIKLWDLRQTSGPISSHHGHSSPVRCMTYEEKGGRLLSGGDDGVVILWSLDNWNNHGGRRECVGLTPPNPQQSTNNIKPGTFIETGRIQGHSSGITCLDCDDIGFISGFSNGSIIRWDFA